MCKPRANFKFFVLIMFNHSNKAVADGALSFYLDHRVSARVAKKTYGIQCNDLYDPANGQHRKRIHKQVIDAAGHACVPDFFSVILPKVCQRFH